MIIAGAGKYYYESLLLNTEFMVYAFYFNGAAFNLLMAGGSMAIPVGFVGLALIEALKLGVPSLIAASRSAYAVYKGTTHIVNVSPAA